MLQFKAWPKTPRLFRDCTITEKIDGTNAAVIVAPIEDVQSWDGLGTPVEVDGVAYAVGAQSRNRLIFPGADNAGFAAYVSRNAQRLAELLGQGHHYGEWWGSNIQRTYGLTKGDKRFSLFNVERYGIAESDHGVPGLGLVPVLWRGTMNTDSVDYVLWKLAQDGSIAAPGFMRPEGIVLFHSAAGVVFKALLENDNAPKGAAAA